MISVFDLIYFSFIILLLIISAQLSFAIRLLKKRDDNRSDENEQTSELNASRIILIGVALIGFAGYFLMPLIQKAGLQAHFLEWINLVVRWSHVILGIAWVGASFYFIFLENSLNRTKDLRDELAGNLWAIHGGGFYYIEKYKNAPSVFPEKLHWFKYEAYFTWVTGFLLLILVYYMNAKSFMIDPAVKNIEPSVAVMIGISSLLGGWIIYDLLCRSPLLARPKLFGITGLVIVILFSFLLSKYLSGRAAFIHIGALLGTIMAGNVFFVIIPSQKALVHAAKNNLPPDPRKGKYAGLRSLHNNYITFPVIFIMISNHFPGTFSPSYNWSILALLTIGSVSIRHYINLFEKGKSVIWFIVFGLIIFFALIYVTMPGNSGKHSAPVKFSQVMPVFQKRCQTCHSSHPTDDVQKVAPNGIIFETPEQIAIQKDRIMFRVVQTKTMPQGNKTGITEDERALIGSWIQQGAQTN